MFFVDFVVCFPSTAEDERCVVDWNAVPSGSFLVCRRRRRSRCRTNAVIGAAVPTRRRKMGRVEVYATSGSAETRQCLSALLFGPGWLPCTTLPR